jgi:AcrR family transcriptional regulator
MAATKHAKNVKKDTKECITTAMTQLLRKEKLSNLTISQVCQRAGVSRMAFYRNFDGLEQIIYEYYQPVIAEVFDTIRHAFEETVKFDIQMKFFEIFGDLLVLANEHEFEPIIQQIFTEEIESFYRESNNEYWTTFMAAGVYAIWKKWLLDGRQKPLEEIMNFLKTVSSIQ